MGVNCDWMAFYYESAGARELAGDWYLCEAVDEEGKKTGVVSVRRGRYVIRGSYDSNVTVTSISGRVYFSGNPSKFGREDNLFGYSMVEAYARCRAILSVVGLESPACPVFTRVDLNTNISFGSALAASSYMRMASATKTSRQRQRAYDGDTVTYGEGSKYFMSKVYLKGVEMKRHDPGRWAEFAFGAGVVRYEAEYKSQFFVHGLRRLSLQGLEGALMKDFLARAASHFVATETFEDVDKLPALVRATYIAWFRGYDPRDLLSRASWYRHRRALLAFGVDIAVSASNVVQGNIPVRVQIVTPVVLEMPVDYELPPAHLVVVEKRRLA